MDSTVIKEQDNQKMEITPEKEKMVIAITTYYGSSAKKDLWNRSQNPLELNLDKTIESALELKRNGLDVEIVIGLDGFKRYDDRKKDLLAKGVLIKEEQEELEEIYKKEAQLKETKRMIDEAFDKMDNLQIAYTAIEANEQMYAGGMRNTIFAEYKNQDTLLTFIDDDDYLIPEGIEYLVNTIRKLKDSNESENKTIVGFNTEDDPNFPSQHEEQAVWGCVYLMKNFNLIPMPAETLLEDRIFRFLNNDKITLSDDINYIETIENIETTKPIYSHSKENLSVSIEIGGSIQKSIFSPFQYSFETEIVINDDLKAKIKDYLITNNITLKDILQKDCAYLLNKAQVNLITIALDCQTRLEIPSIEDLKKLQEENKLNEIEIKKLLYKTLKTIDFDRLEQISKTNEDIYESFHNLKNKKLSLEKEIEELERTGGGTSPYQILQANPKTEEEKSKDIRHYTVTKNDFCEHKKIAINTFDSQFISKEINQPKKIKKSRKKVKQPKKNLEEQSKLSEKLKNMSEDLLEISLTESLQETELVLEDPKNKIKDK